MTAAKAKDMKAINPRYEGATVGDVARALAKHGTKPAPKPKPLPRRQKPAATPSI